MGCWIKEVGGFKAKPLNIVGIRSRQKLLMCEILLAEGGGQIDAGCFFLRDNGPSEISIEYLALSNG
jgi:hypothetical protein